MKKYTNIINKLNLSAIAIIFTILVIIAGGTYAVVVWSSLDNTELTVRVGDYAKVVFNKGNNINVSNPGPVFYYTDGEMTEFSITNYSNSEVIAHVSLDLSSVSAILRTNSFKYAVETSTDNVNFNKVDEGDFSELSIATTSTESTNPYDLTLSVGQSVATNSTLYFKVYFYIDANILNSVSIQTGSLIGTLNVSAGPANTVTYVLYDMFTGKGDVTTAVTNNHMTYTIADDVITVTSNRADGFGYTPYRVNLTAGKTYIFHVDSSGTYGSGSSQTQAFLMKDGSTSEKYYHMSSANYTFTPEVTGQYWLRLDVNTLGETHTFSNIRISEVYGTAEKLYNCANTGTVACSIGDLPTPSLSGYEFIGWFGESYVDHPLYFYSDLYSDLKTAFSYDETKLINHYFNYGKKEGRRVSEYSYRTNYPSAGNITLYGYMHPTT